LRIVSSTAGETSASERKIALPRSTETKAVGNAVAGHRLLDEVRIDEMPAFSEALREGHASAVRRSNWGAR